MGRGARGPIYGAPSHRGGGRRRYVIRVSRNAKGWALAGAAAACLWAGAADARCPEEDPGDTLCEPVVSMLMPSAFGMAFFPGDAGGAYYGGGVEMALFSWASNTDTFGPSHGRVRANVAYLDAPSSDRRMLVYRLGAIVSFEGNASRRFLIPDYGASFGALWESQLGDRVLADATLGLFLVHTRDFVLDAEGGYVLPLTAVDKLIGPQAQLTAAFALW